MAKRVYSRYGTVRWLDDDNARHREDGPAVVWADGTQYWFNRGKSHFAHGPAILNDDGRLRWYEAGELLRRRHPYG